MKIFSALFIVWFLGGNCFAGESDAANSVKSIVGQHLPRHIKKAIRKDGKPDKTDIKPVVQTTGITTGFVLVYGHAIQPPYQVRVENDKVLINGVPVGPGTTENDILSKSAVELRSKAKRMFCEGNGKKSPVALAEEILKLFKQATDTVITAKWSKSDPLPTGVLLVYWKRGVRQSDIRFVAAACANYKPENSQVAAADSSNHRLERYSSSFKKALESGKLLFFGSDGHIATLAGDTAEKLNGVMKDGTLGRKELTDKIEKLGFGRSGAREILGNYEPR